MKPPHYLVRAVRALRRRHVANRAQAAKAKFQALDTGDNPNAHLDVTGRAMPAITMMPASSARYYNIHFLDDGFPAQRREDGTLYEHPLYPQYLTEEYLKQYGRDPDPALLDAAQMVMQAGLKRAEPFQESLVFWYGADANVKRASHRHYSAMTQAYYAMTLSRLDEALGGAGDYARIAGQFANSLTIAAAQGGVMQTRPQGIGIEELPLKMPDLVLNGWLTALVSISAQPKLIRQAGLERMLNDNLDLVEYLLPRYDLPNLHNSRYSLSGFTYLRLAGAKLTLWGPKTDWSSSEAYGLGLGDAYRWDNFLLESDATALPDGSFASRGKSLRANLVLSQLAEENAFEFVGQADRDAEISVEVMVGENDPRSTKPMFPKWVRLAPIRMGTEKRGYRIVIPPSLTALVGYPTNFQKSFDGVNRNVYHPIHIKGLHQLSRFQDRQAFGDYARRWTGYILDWKHDPLYAGLAGHDYTPQVPAAMRKILNPSKPS